MDTDELAAFLRARREAIAPGDLTAGERSRRRTPGLRREEVAERAHISTEYYTQLEQGRAATPSPTVLRGLAAALALDPAQHDHLLFLSGAIPTLGRVKRDVPSNILAMIDGLERSAAFVTSAMFDVLAWNPLAAALMEDFGARDPSDRNLARRAFLNHTPPLLYGVSDLQEFRRHTAHRLRAAAARYPDDPDLRALLEDLMESRQFRDVWAEHDVSAQTRLQKTFAHTPAGLITVDCDLLDVPDRDQHVVVYTAVPGSDSEEALRRLSRPSVVE